MEWIKHLFFFLFGMFNLQLVASQRLSPNQGGPTCEPIKIDLCRNIGLYNMTGMPNLAGNKLQADAKFELETYTPLLQFNCANELPFFLCSVYVPMCNVMTNSLIGPCRPMCDRVKLGCLPLLTQVQLPWPKKLECSNFPLKNDMHNMCMEGPGENAPPVKLPPSTINEIETNPNLMEKVKETLSNVETYKKLKEKYDKQQAYLDQLEKTVGEQEPARSRINYPSTDAAQNEVRRYGIYSYKSIQAAIMLCEIF